MSSTASNISIKVEEGSCTFCGKYSSTLEEHLESKNHKSAAKNGFCHFCGLQFLSFSDLKNHKDESEDHDTKTITRRWHHRLFKMESDSLKAKLDLELQRLVYYHYYSNSFPYNVTLEYLKHYHYKINSNDNEEIEVKKINFPLLQMLKEDLRVLFECDEKANSIRIKVLQGLESLVTLIKNLESNYVQDWPLEKLLTLLTNWNEILVNVKKANRI